MEIDHNFTYLDVTILETLTSEDQKYIELSKEIAKDVVSNKITILETIKKLGCLLLSQSFSKRNVGVLLLSETLHNLENGHLNLEQLTVLSAYFCEKLKDHHEVATSALKGTLALIRFKNIPSESIIQLISHIFNHITCQQQQQQERYLIFQIYETVLKQHVYVADSMGIDFVYGVISSIDGERDPKNLVYLFKWLQNFLKTVKLGHLSEEMFEVLACYFPVDFKAPPSDKIKITREDLAQGLCECLTLIPDFGQYGIPLALEKLDSALKIAKGDSLDLLRSGCKNYDTETYYEYSSQILSHIQKEILSDSVGELRLKYLETLKAIVSKLSLEHQDNFENLIVDLADTLIGNFLPDSKLFLQSSLILGVIARASPSSSIIIVKRVAPLLENTFKITNNPKQKALILKTLIHFVKAVIETHNDVNLAEFREIANSPPMCFQAITDKEPDLVIEGHEGFSAIAQHITEDLLEIYLGNLRQALLAPLTSNVKYVVLKNLETIAKIYPQKVERDVLLGSADCDLATVDNYLEGLRSLVQLPYFEDYITNTFIEYATHSVEGSTISFKHLCYILSNKSNPISELLLKKDFVSVLIDFLVTVKDIEPALATNFLNGINNVLQSLMRSQNASTQRDIYLVLTIRSFKDKNVFLMVLSGLIVPMQRGVFEDYDKVDFLLDCFLNTNEEFVRDISVQVLVNVLNKIESESMLVDILSKMEAICDSCNNDAKVWLISWMTKGLVMRNHTRAWYWTDLLLNCLKDYSEAAKGFRVVMDDHYQVISKENYCQIMPLYKQKFFLYCTNKLNVLPQNYDAACLNSVGYLIENAPKLAILGHFEKIFRLILLCLEKATEPTVLEILIQRIKEFVTNRETVIEAHLEDILLRILDLTKFEASMTVRIAAIRCLHQITVTYKVYQLLPYKHRVIQQLGSCVDDRKRLVRREAMECRSMWYLLDAPE